MQNRRSYTNECIVTTLQQLAIALVCDKKFSEAVPYFQEAAKIRGVNDISDTVRNLRQSFVVPSNWSKQQYASSIEAAAACGMISLAATNYPSAVLFFQNIVRLFTAAFGDFSDFSRMARNAAPYFKMPFIQEIAVFITCSPT